MLLGMVLKFGKILFYNGFCNLTGSVEAEIKNDYHIHWLQCRL